MKYRYSYQAEGTGYYAKFGVIVTPVKGLRLGAVIQTPTINSINEIWQYAGETRFSSTGYQASSPEGDFSYIFRAPYRANFGAAFTFGNHGVISADYEMCDYSTMEFRTNGADMNYFADLNEEIKRTFCTSHSIRVGAEARLGAYAARIGYGITSSPEKHLAWANTKQNFSFGLGYSSKGSFYADIAARKNFITKEYYMPYSDYIFDDEGYIAEPTPELIIRKSDWKVLLTLGWRF